MRLLSLRLYSPAPRASKDADSATKRDSGENPDVFFGFNKHINQCQIVKVNLCLRLRGLDKFPGPYSVIDFVCGVCTCMYE